MYRVLHQQNNYMQNRRNSVNRNLSLNNNVNYPFFIIHRFNFRHNSNFIPTNMQEFSYCPRTVYRNTTLSC
jgi:hypothetical protein